jgi:RNA polymerase sigma factor (TIGR02999 family)
MAVLGMGGATPAGEVTRLLRQFRPEDGQAAAQLMELIYPELRRIAKSRFRRETPGHLLQPTALVHEAYLRLVTHQNHEWKNRAHFFAAAANLMRRILIDDARSRHAQKREGERPSISLDQAGGTGQDNAVDLLDLDRALVELEQLSPRQARVVEMRYFAGLSVPEIATVLGLTSRSVNRDWATARAWLRGRLSA